MNATGFGALAVIAFVMLIFFTIVFLFLFIACLGGDTAGHYTRSVSDLKAEPTVRQSDGTHYLCWPLSLWRLRQLRSWGDDRYCVPCSPHLSLKLSEKEI